MIVAPAQAREALVVLDEINVQASSDDQDFKNLPHSVSVITAEDIARSTASSVSDLLSREAGLSLMSFYGSDKKTSIDIRGMGDTAVSNVLILVDGVKLNEFDLSGADLTTIAISQIERVEILRGGGSVEYGDGAVGGVINIITKRGHAGQKASASIEATRGSFGLEDLRANFRGAVGPFAATVNLSQLDTDGYRKNSDLFSRNGSVELRFMPNDILDMYLRVSSHRDEHGFPGPVSLEGFATESGRRSTKSPNDRGWTDDDTYAAGINLALGGGMLKVYGSFRDRVNDWIMSPNPNLSVKEQLWTIDSQRENYKIEYSKYFELFGLKQYFAVGADHLSGDYVRYENGRHRIDQSSKKLGDVGSKAEFLILKLMVHPTVTVNGGFREERFNSEMVKQSFSEINCQWTGFPPRKVPGSCNQQWVTGSVIDNKWRNTGSELGVAWSPYKEMTLFLSHTETFRSPNIDELAEAAVDLRPQSGRTTEMGLRFSPSKRFSSAFTLFHMKNKDEIYYGPPSAGGNQQNRNYDEPTRRGGMELESKWQVLDSTSLRFNAGYVQPKFVGSGADVPHVPRKTANISVLWNPSTQFSINAALRYAGAKYDGLDLSNKAFPFPMLPSYTVVDASATYILNKVDITVGINNVFDKTYVTMGYGGYYPMPGRNGFIRVRFKF